MGLRKKEENMRKNGLLTISVTMAFVLFAGAIWAQSVLKSDMGSPLEVVKARKMLMQAVSANIDDIGGKFESGKMAAIKANGDSIAAISVVLPPLFKETYAEVYPVEGSKSFFKGAPPEGFEKASAEMMNAGLGVKKAAADGNRDAVSSAMEALSASCKGCHSAYRGKY
jgi:cytochrome c556